MTMAELPAATREPLVEALEGLHRQLAEAPTQPVVQLAEQVVLHWHRVVEAHEAVQPRLVASGYLPNAFHFGIEPDARNRLDDAGVRPGGEGMAEALADRLEGLERAVRDYFARPGYRSSSDQCDQLMVELGRMSRFLGTWCLEAELAHRRAYPHGRVGPEADADLYSAPAAPSWLWQARWALAFWEPLLNAALAAWHANALEQYDAALHDLQAALGWSENERRERLDPPGYPVRARGQGRLKVAVLQPEPRPLRTRSVLWVRYAQLVERIRTALYLEQAQADALLADVEHFRRMVARNHFMLASQPGFQTRGRPGVSVIRGRPTTHPILLDTRGFFKKAVLFHNGTYTVAGGGVDLMYMQLRQLERFLRYEGWSGPWKALRGPVEASLLGWEENDWAGFTEGLLALAELLRPEDAHGPRT